jgi:hypothetical protein
VNDIAIVRMSRTTPMTQFSSRGYLYAPKKNVLPVCKKIRTTITVEPQRCMPRTNSPRKTSFVRYRVDS